MRKAIVGGIRRLILPVLLAAALILLEARLGDTFAYPFPTDAAGFVLAVSFTLLVLLLGGDFAACGVFVFTVCLLPPARMLFICLTRPNIFPDDGSVIAGALNWVAITGTCVVLRFFQKKRPVRNFPSFFTMASMVFLLFYLYAFSLTLFLDFPRGFLHQYRLRSLNLVPLVKTILPYMTGTAHTNFMTPILNMASNFFLFVPVGFYLGIFSRKINAGLRVSVIIGVPVLAETLQYVFACGFSDIDDVLVNALGGFAGMLLCFAMEKACRCYRKSAEARLFVFR